MRRQQNLYRGIAEKALGKPLPPKAIVHHVDEDETNNEPNNLVVCPDQAYHMLLHARQRVMDAGGNPNTQKVCGVCEKVLVKDAFCLNAGQWDGRHNKCRECMSNKKRGNKKYSYWNEALKLKQQERRARVKATHIA